MPPFPCPHCGRPLPLAPSAPLPAVGDLSMCDGCLDFVAWADDGWEDPSDDRLEVVTEDQEVVLQAYRRQILDQIPDRWLVLVREEVDADDRGNNTFVQIWDPVPTADVEGHLQDIFAADQASYVAVFARAPDVDQVREILEEGEADDLLDIGAVVQIFELQISPLSAAGPVAEA